MINKIGVIHFVQMCFNPVFQNNGLVLQESFKSILRQGLGLKGQGRLSAFFDDLNGGRGMPENVIILAVRGNKAAP